MYRCRPRSCKTKCPDFNSDQAAPILLNPVCKSLLLQLACHRLSVDSAAREKNDCLVLWDWMTRGGPLSQVLAEEERRDTDTEGERVEMSSSNTLWRPRASGSGVLIILLQRCTDIPMHPTSGSLIRRHFFETDASLATLVGRDAWHGASVRLLLRVLPLKLSRLPLVGNLGGSMWGEGSPSGHKTSDRER